MPFLVAFVVALLVAAGFGRLVLRAFRLLALGMLLFFVVAIAAAVMTLEFASHAKVAGQGTSATATQNLPPSQRGPYGLNTAPLSAQEVMRRANAARLPANPLSRLNHP